MGIIIVEGDAREKQISEEAHVPGGWPQIPGPPPGGQGVPAGGSTLLHSAQQGQEALGGAGLQVSSVLHRDCKV